MKSAAGGSSIALHVRYCPRQKLPGVAGFALQVTIGGLGAID
jgi:hypothetical protein